MDLFGGLMKGLKPLMDVTGVKPDESMQLTIVQGEVMELEGKKREVLAELGQATYDMVKSNTLNNEKLLSLCTKVDEAESQLNLKRAELEKSQRAAEEKKREEEAKLASRTCPSCGEVNPEGTRFCQNCGSKLGIEKPSGNVCKACGAANSPESRFCGECGAKLEPAAPAEIKCPGCGTVNPPGTRFCGECGTRI
jgi:uncharacterized OB-fold protein